MIISKKLKIILIAVLILVLGIGIGFGLGKMKYSRKVNSSGISQTSEIGTKSDGESEDFVGEYKVARVIDGDTIEIEGGAAVKNGSARKPKPEPEDSEKL